MSFQIVLVTSTAPLTIRLPYVGMLGTVQINDETPYNVDSATDFSIVLSTAGTNTVTFTNVSRMTSASTTSNHGTYRQTLTRFRYLQQISTLVGFNSAFQSCTNLVEVTMADDVMNNVSSCLSMFEGCTSFNQPINWNFGAAAPSCDSMFRSCTALNSQITLSTSSTNTISFRLMFTDCTKLNTVPVLPIANADSFSSMFQGCTSLNQPINWNLGSAAPSCVSMFQSCFALNSQITLTTTSQTTMSFASMFRECIRLNITPVIPIANANSFLQTFQGCTSFNQPINWHLGGQNPTCQSMFQGCRALNQVVQITTNSALPMSFTMMFLNCIALNVAPVISTTKALSFQSMFQGCSAFNQPINWNVGPRNPNCQSMFQDCSALNQPITLTSDSTAGMSFAFMFLNCRALNVAPVIPTANASSFQSMFQGCNVFNQPINWTIGGQILSCESMFQDCRSLNQLIQLTSTSTLIVLFQYMFLNCTALNVAPVLPTANASSFLSTFQGCSAFNQPINWNVGSRTPICQSMFQGCTFLNQPITLTTSATAAMSFASMFEGCQALNQLLTLPLNNASSLAFMLKQCTSYNQPIASTSSFLSSCEGMFEGCTSLNASVQVHSLSSTSISYARMFYGCTALNTAPNMLFAKVSTLQSMFQECTALNQPIQFSLGAECPSLASMFEGCTSLNADVAIQSTGTTTLSCASMFRGCSSLNALLTLPFALATNMSSMLLDCVSWNQSLASWSIASLTQAANMLDNTAMSVRNYSDTLIAWSQAVAKQSNVALGAEGLMYDDAGLLARQVLTDTFGWIIGGDSLAPPIDNTICFVAGTQVQTDQGVFAIERLCLRPHSILGVPIRRVTTTVSVDPHLVVIEANGLSPGVPSQRTEVSLNHRIMVPGRGLTCARDIVNGDSVYLRKYRGERLYNVLLASDKPGIMWVHGMLCETLDPSNSLVRALEGLDQCCGRACVSYVAEANRVFCASRKSAMA